MIELIRETQDNGNTFINIGEYVDINDITIVYNTYNIDKIDLRHTNQSLELIVNIGDPVEPEFINDCYNNKLN